MSKGNVSLVDGHIDEPSADEFETITDDGTIMGWRSMEEGVFAVGRELTPYKYKVIRTDFENLEKVLNNCCIEFPNYSLREIIPEHRYNMTLAVVILRREYYLGGEQE